MPTIFERLIGINLEEGSQIPSDQKAAIHALGGCLNFYGQGDITGQNIAAWFDLVGEQRDDVIYMSQLAADAQAINRRTQWMRVWKDFLYNGEWGTAVVPFQTELKFWQAIRDVIVDNGGTATPIPQYLKDRFGI